MPSVLLAASLLAVCFLWLNSRLGPVLEALAVAQVSNAVTAAVNDAVLEGITQKNISYDDMVTIEMDGSGRAAVLKGNMSRANLLRGQLLEAALEAVSGLSRESFSVPLGSLLGVELLSGRGPGIQLEVLAGGVASASFHNEFLDAGVNQTLHRIFLEVSVSARIVLPGRMVETVVQVPVCVAETVIVGQVPGTFLQLGGA